MTLYQADENRKAITTTKTRVDCNETKLDIFSSTNIPIEEFAPKTNLTPYNDIKRLYLDIETLGLNPLQDRIISIGMKDNNQNYHLFTGQNEKEILQQSINFITAFKPKIIAGYNLFNFDLPFIIKRCNKYGINQPFNRGRLDQKCSGAFVFGKPIYFLPVWLKGCDIVDTYHLVLQYDNVARKLSKYDLKTATIEMGLRDDRRLELSHNQITDSWNSGDNDTIETYLKYDLDDTELLTNRLLPSVYYQKLLLPDVNIQNLIRLGTGTKWQMILDNAYRGNEEPIPDDKLSYEGAITLATSGLHKDCGKIDVGSLYPSIMLKYGICSRKDTDRKLLGVLKHLTEERLRLKELAKHGDIEADYKQSSMKIFINSAYGCLGVGGVGYNDMEAAALVSAYGRTILLYMLEFIESKGGKMIECDTDGIIFSHPDLATVHQELQDKLPDGINIDLEWVADGVYIPSDKNGNGLKKNYVVFLGEKTILKGKFRKREVCQIEREFPVKWLRLYLESPQKAQDYYKELKQEILSGNYPISKLSQKRKIKVNEKQLKHLGDHGDVITFWESMTGKTSTDSDGYNAYHYLGRIDDILSNLKIDIGLKDNPNTVKSEQLSLF